MGPALAGLFVSDGAWTSISTTASTTCLVSVSILAVGLEPTGLSFFQIRRSISITVEHTEASRCQPG